MRTQIHPGLSSITWTLKLICFELNIIVLISVTIVRVFCAISVSITQKNSQTAMRLPP